MESDRLQGQEPGSRTEQGFLHRFQRGREGLWSRLGSMPEALELVVEPGSEPRTVPHHHCQEDSGVQKGQSRADGGRVCITRVPGGKRWQGQKVGRPWLPRERALSASSPAAVGAWVLWTETQAGEMLQPEPCVLAVPAGLLQPPGTTALSQREASASSAGQVPSLSRVKPCSCLIPPSFS